MAATNVDVVANLGLLEVGTLVAFFLLGITTMQAIIYYQNFSTSDRWQLKTLVLIVWFLEVAHSIAIARGFYTISISLYNHPESILSKADLGYTIGILLSGVIGSIVQGFFAERVRRVTRRIYFAAIGWFFSFFRLLGIIGMAMMFAKRSPSEFNEWRWVASTAWLIGAVADISIAVPLTVEFAQKRRCAMKRTRPILDRLIVMTIHTGVLTGFTTTTIAICFIAMPNSYAYAAVATWIAKFFSISLFATLNARTQFRTMLELEDFTIDIPNHPTLHFSQPLPDETADWHKPTPFVFRSTIPESTEA